MILGIKALSSKVLILCLSLDDKADNTGFKHKNPTNQQTNKRKPHRTWKTYDIFAKKKLFIFE